jgi:serine/threonine protein kinase
MTASTALCPPEKVESRSGRTAGDEPVPGYRLVKLLGQGGFGEVWKCLGPGNAARTIKIVRFSHSLDDVDSPPNEREQAAIERIRDIRHPQLISVERVERVDGELFVVAELADRSLSGEFERQRGRGRRGIPEAVLLPYLLEAAEVLDALNAEHGLQHLAVTPTNLMLVDGHIKLADFGFLSAPAGATLDGDPHWWRGCSLKYAPPELLGGAVSPSSDQYSLAIVYQEMISGNVPFEGEGFHDALMKRLTWAPNLHGLPDSDWPVVARALSADPARRFPSCVEFILALADFRINSHMLSAPSTNVDVTPPAGLQDPYPSDRLSAPSTIVEKRDGRAVSSSAVTVVDAKACEVACPSVHDLQLQDPPPAEIVEKISQNALYDLQLPDPPAEAKAVEDQKAAQDMRLPDPPVEAKTVEVREAAQDLRLPDPPAEAKALVIEEAVPALHLPEPPIEAKALEIEEAVPALHLPDPPAGAKTAEVQEPPPFAEPFTDPPATASAVEVDGQAALVAHLSDPAVEEATMIVAELKAAVVTPTRGLTVPNENRPLAGFNLLKMVRKTGLAESWEARDDADQVYLVQILLGAPHGDSPQVRQALDRLRLLRHSCLQELRYTHDRFGRLAAIAPIPETTLRQRLLDCRRERLVGIPRDELMGYLTKVAEALDELYERYKVRHLGLNPLNLVLDDNDIQIAEFGQIPIMWLPQGNAAGHLNSVYSAPELDRPGDSPTADQFSLAIIYVEMLTGKPPKRGKSDREFELFLSPLPPTERRVIERACRPDPKDRFASCLEMMQELTKRPPQRLCLTSVSVEGRPPVLHYSDLEHGLEPRYQPLFEPLPSAEKFIANLIAWHTGRDTGSREMPPVSQLRNPVFEESFPIQAIPIKLLKHKFQVILEQCDSRDIERTDHAIGFIVDGKAPERTYFRKKQQQSLHVIVAVEEPETKPAVFSNVSVRIEPLTPDGAELEPGMAALRSRILRTIRTSMHEAPERRSEVRTICDFAAKLYPVIPDWRPEQVVVGRVTDLCAGGIGLVVPFRPPTKHVYLRPEGPQDEHAVLIQIVRCRTTTDGGYALGCELGP